MLSDKIMTRHKFYRKFKVSIPTRKDWVNCRPPPDGMVYYTDASLIVKSADRMLRSSEN